MEMRSDLELIDQFSKQHFILIPSVPPLPWMVKLLCQVSTVRGVCISAEYRHVPIPFLH